MASNTESVPETSNQNGTSEEPKPEEDEIEEGELPEEGEIMDDDDDEKTTQAENQAPVHQHKSGRDSLRESSSRSKPTPLLSYDPSSSSRKRASPSNNEDACPSKRSGREMSPEYSSVQLAPKRRQPWTEGVLCKFFREGYCRDGLNCAYSHDAAHSNRKPELCKFYQQGFCKKGLACTLLHGEYPCKAYHEDKCDKSPCKYSHMPLNDYTKSIFEQMVQDEALAAQIIIPQIPAKRRVLLPRPAPGSVASVSAPSVVNRTPPSVASPEDRPPSAPLVMVPQVAPSPIPAPSIHGTPDMNQVLADPDERMVIEEAAREQTMNAENQQSTKTGFSFGAMLEEMTNTTKKSPTPEFSTAAGSSCPPGETWRETTASVEASPEFVPQRAPLLPKPEEKQRIYRVIPQEDYDPDYDIEFLNKLATEKFKDDPRVPSIMKRQFDRGSSMFGQMPPPAPETCETMPVKVEKAPLARDPRSRPQDPRQRQVAAASNAAPSPPQNQGAQSAAVPQIITTNFDVHAGVPLPTKPVTALNEADLKSLAEKQLQMINGVQVPHPEPVREHASFGYSDSGYSEDPGTYRSSPKRYNEYVNDSNNRRDYTAPRYDRGNGFERNYDDYGSYEERGRGGARGRGRGGYYDGDRRDYRGSRHVERLDPRWESRGPADSYRREAHRGGDRERKDYPRTGRFRERSRSPRPAKPEPVIEERPMTMREKRKNNEYQSPLARA